MFLVLILIKEKCKKEKKNIKSKKNWTIVLIFEIIVLIFRAKLNYVCDLWFLCLIARESLKFRDAEIVSACVRMYVCVTQISIKIPGAHTHPL